MPIMLKQEDRVYPKHPAGGPYPAVISEILFREDVETTYGIKNKLRLIFQTSELMRDHDESVTDDRPMTVAVSVNATVNEKGRFMGYLSQQVPADELKALLSGGEFDVEQQLLGTQWLLSIEHHEDNGKTHANITSAMKAPAEQQISIWVDDSGF